MTQEVMYDGIRKDLLNVKDTDSVLYSTIRNNRYVNKTESISSGAQHIGVVCFTVPAYPSKDSF